MQQLAQAADVALQHRAGIGGLVVAPQLVREPIGRHDPAVGGHEHRQDLARLRATDRHELGAAPDLHVAQNADVERAVHVDPVLQTRLQRACRTCAPLRTVAASALEGPRRMIGCEDARCDSTDQPTSGDTMTTSTTTPTTPRPPDVASRQPEQGAVGEGRLHPDRRTPCAPAARTSCDASASPPASRCSTSAAVTGPPPSRPPRRGRACAGIDIAANLVAAGTRRAEQLGLDELHVRGGRRLEPGQRRRRPVRSRRLRVRGDVRAAPVRHRRRDGARHQAGWAHRDGQLDPRRPDARRPDPAHQRRVLAAATGGLRQPGHLGRRGTRPRALQRGRCPQRPHHV